MKPSLEREADLFDAARSLPAGAKRAAFLDRACAGDPELRGRIESLLRAEAESERFFREGRAAMGAVGIPAEFKADLATGEPALGGRVGPYHLIEKLGEGGWGSVYLAEQEEPFRRRVALKLIRLDLESQSVMARFEAERQALAMMDHPSIARVYDAGMTPQGMPYLVMELVQGARLTEYCDRHRLTLRERLLLFVEVCHAIQHAHQKGVVHGDIKPSNILITLHDGLASPKVIDFGISRATEMQLNEDAVHQVYGPLIGTPAYMSPEQAELGSLSIDTRSDIYSLGVLLYELLAGETPFRTEDLLSSGVEGMRQILRERAPARPSERLLALPASRQAEVAAARRLTPSRLASALRGDLDNIALRALEKERQRRYETANALAVDLQRHLQDEPIAACPGTRVYRLRKLIRRNRGVFAATGAVLLALVAGLGTSTWLLIKEREARRRAVAAEQEQNELRQKAEVREQITQAALLVNQERFDEADRLMDGVRFSQPTVEGAAVMRSLGEWHALQNRWAQAEKRFAELLQVNQLDGRDRESLDYLEEGPAVVKLNDAAAFARFRDRAIRRFAGTSFEQSDRILKASLLVPATPEVLESLRPIAEVTAAYYRRADEAGDQFQAAWRAMSLGLWEYRCGHFAEAERWCRRCLASSDANLPRAVTAQLIVALAEFRTGRPATARADLAAVRGPIEQVLRQPLTGGTPTQGFWFDWEFAGILLREAEALMPKP